MMEAQLVRLWVQYNIPRIEDGNNFGVGIQEEVLSEASSIERDACTFLDQITRFVYFSLFLLMFLSTDCMNKAVEFFPPVRPILPRMCAKTAPSILSCT